MSKQSLQLRSWIETVLKTYSVADFVAKLQGFKNIFYRSFKRYN